MSLLVLASLLWFTLLGKGDFLILWSVSIDLLHNNMAPDNLMLCIIVFSFGKRPTQVHRYGVVANREDLEMAPLDSDDGEEDDTTHFDISKHRLQ